ncbi:hypothetical protein GCM10008018_36620 [Paenibacillus marchantiophytorum]|uniref:Uncharacterized protein n=1 Tax=Paenibacillus marchantiophytorum TaxID=1619310 RepID=A0ABQ1EV06_9BACL|nr:hypothetical protein [Paenibacillus marchantiophytorum]GFZ87141.1 hypothetical protein GCM10008018_36620 [Paenibacillus marchantiophytorum]
MKIQNEFYYKQWLLTYSTKTVVIAPTEDRWIYHGSGEVQKIFMPAIPIPIPVTLEWVDFQKINSSIYSIYKDSGKALEHIEFAPYPIQSKYYFVDIQAYPNIEAHIRRLTQTQEVIWITTYYFDGESAQSNSNLLGDSLISIGGVYLQDEEPEEALDDPFSVMKENNNVFKVVKEILQ